MAIENELLALTFGALNVLSFEVWFQNGCGLDQCFPSAFGIDAKFPQQKFGNISPYFRDGNPAMLHLKCITMHKMLLSPSFRRENMAMGMPHFHGKNPTEFRVWCAMVHGQGFASVYMVHIDMLIL